MINSSDVQSRASYDTTANNNNNNTYNNNNNVIQYAEPQDRYAFVKKIVLIIILSCFDSYLREM